MKHIVPFGFLLMLAMGCTQKVVTTQFSDTSPVRAVNETVTKSGKHEHRTVTIDSTPQYRDCLSDMNRREMGTCAVQYCQCLTSPEGDEKACMVHLLSCGGPSMLYGAGYQQGYAPVGPMGYNGGWTYAGTSMDPAVTAVRLAGQGYPVHDHDYVTREQMRPVLKQVADNTARNAETNQSQPANDDSSADDE